MAGDGTTSIARRFRICGLLPSRGVRADGLIPSFPSKTFPNHYTVVTGLYPEHHGIVSNVIVDPGFPERFTMTSQTAKTRAVVGRRAAVEHGHASGPPSGVDVLARV